MDVLFYTAKIKNNYFIYLLLLSCVSAQALVLDSLTKPNFIIILADDLGYADLSMNGSLQIKTPNIDYLAKTGVSFTQGYVSSAVCSPSRAGLLTGKNQVEFGYNNNLPSKTVKGVIPKYEGLPPNQPTIAERLKAIGYKTGLIGKWHLGREPHFHPTNRGFDKFWGYISGGHDYFVSLPTGKGYRSPIECNYKTPQKISYLTDDKGDECVNFIKEHKDSPFFLYASFNAPHAPMQALEDDIARYSNIKDEKRRIYAAMVHRLDINVGKINKALKNAGIDKNTIVIFLSDNGGPVFNNFSSNAPFNGQKGTLLEGGIHVPFIMRWKGKLKEGTVYNQSVTSLDIAPTLYELAGGNPIPNEFSGVNLIPFLIEKNNAVPHKELKWKFTISAAIREGNWKLIRIPDKLPMLFDLSKDVSEQNDLTLEFPEIANKLLKKLGKWDVKLPYLLFREEPQFRHKQLESYYHNYNLLQPE